MYIELVKHPDVFLRSISNTVPFPLDDKTSRLIRFMTKAMYQNHGIGLAAIQVGYQLRMFVMDCSRSGDNSKVFINPEIVEKSDETLRDTEGCLSAPGKQGDVRRHLRIILKYQDQNGKEERKTFYNLEARCIQHEMDHLDGKLCIDYEKGKSIGTPFCKRVAGGVYFFSVMRSARDPSIAAHNLWLCALLTES